MSPDDVIEVAPAAIRFKLAYDLDLGGVRGGEWDLDRRVSIDLTDKHVSMFQRYAEGMRWQDTQLFQGRYSARLMSQRVRGATTLDDLAAVYEREVDPIFRDMKKHGFRTEIAGKPVALPKVHVARNGEVILGNQGNHRLGMAKVLGLQSIPVRIHTVHARYPAPTLPECAAHIPAMTSEEERLAYYRMAREAVKRGHIVELGAWLGAATAYLAAAVKDAGDEATHGFFGYVKPLHVFDRFVWDPSHHAKGARSKDLLGDFKRYLGPLLDVIAVHHGEITEATWDDLYRVSMIVFDAPKRIPAISDALSTFAPALREGALMVWQDFAYFPSYDIPAAMTRLGDRVEFVEGIYPGTTAVFKVVKPIHDDFSPEWIGGPPRRDPFFNLRKSALSLKAWSADEIEREWDRWAAMLPEPMRPRFQCGAACFLVDNGHIDRGKAWLESIVEASDPEPVISKWRVLKRDRPHFVARWQPLFQMLSQMGLL